MFSGHQYFFIMKGPLHTAHHSDARADGRKDGDECLNHQFPNLSFFHDFLIFDFNFPFPVLCHFSDEVLNNSSERSEESVNVSKT